MDSTWPLQDAQNNLSEPVAVVVSAEAYAQLRPQEKLADILRDCPVKGWKLERDEAPPREVRFQ